MIPRLSRDLRNELPGVKGFSERNLKRMIRFYREYPSLLEEVPQPVAQRQATPSSSNPESTSCWDRRAVPLRIHPQIDQDIRVLGRARERPPTLETVQDHHLRTHERPPVRATGRQIQQRIP